jgi:hypothetical protein
MELRRVIPLDTLRHIRPENLREIHQMKTAMKTAIALAGAALVGGTAQAQIVTNTPLSAGGSDLELFVTDFTTNTYFVQDLGNPLNSIYSKSQVQTDGVLTSDGQFSLPSSINGSDALLAGFLSGKSSDNVQYSILAADHTNTGVTLGAQRGLLSSLQDLTGGNPIGSQSPNFTNANVSTFSNNVSTFTKFINNNYGSSNTSTLSGWGDTSAEGITSDGKLAPISWISQSLSNGAAIGTAQKLYMFATNGSGLSGLANVYVGGTIDISSAGVISYTAPTSPVPLPAAVWLLGSGLLGLIGVGRRRSVAA